MSLFQKIKFFFFERKYGRKIYNMAYQWEQSVKNWGFKEWKEYWINKLNERLTYPWNKEFYGISRIKELDELPNLPILRAVPKLNFKKRILGKSISAGTTAKPKVIPFTSDDFWELFKCFRFYIRNKLAEKDILFVSTGMKYTSGQYFEIAMRIIRAGGGATDHLTLPEVLGKRKPKIKVSVVTTLLAHIYPLFENIPSDYFKKELDITLTGDVITGALVKAINIFLNEKGLQMRDCFNMYGASEVLGIIAASDKGEGYDKLTVYPDVQISYIQRVKIKEEDIEIEEKLTPIWKAKKGDMGYIVLTSLRDYLLINYAGLKDIIEVKDPNVFPPKIYPVGRIESRIDLGFSSAINEQVSGLYGTIVRTAGMPLNYMLLCEFISNLYPKIRFFIFVKDYGLKAKILIYSEKKIDVEKILAEIRKKGPTTTLRSFVAAHNLEYENIVNPNFIKEIYEILPNERALKYRKTPKVIQYIVKKMT